MTERVVSIKLNAQIANYLANMETARKKAKEVGDTLEKQQAASIAAAQAQGEAAKKLGAGLLAVGTLAVVGFSLAIAKASEFDAAMSNVAATGEDARNNIDALREAALDAGAETVFSATEAANAIEELGKAGLSTAQILSGGLDGALSLAAAGQLGVADAAAIAAIAVKQFKLEGADVPHVADLLAAGAGKAVGDVSDLSAALGQAGLVANQTGLSIEETTGVLAAFADQGLLGSDAGTSLKTMLQSLVPSSEKAAKEMTRLGISAYDSSGQFIGAAEFAGNYQNALKDLTPEQQAATSKIIFGSDAVRAANVFYGLGAKGIQEYIDQTNDAGYAADVAATRLDNLTGDVEQLGGAFDTALIKSGSVANDTLRFLTQAATGAVDAFGQLPGPAQGVAVGIGGITAAATLGVGAFLTLAPKVVEYRDALKDLGPTAQKTGKVVGVAMKGLGALAVAGTAIALIAQLDRAMQGAGASATDLGNALGHGDIKDAIEKSFLGAGSFTDATVNIDKFGEALDDVAGSWDTRWAGVFGPGFIGWMDGTDEATDTTRDGLANLGEALAGMSSESAQQSLRDLRDEYDLTDEQILTLINNSGPYKDALIAQADAAGLLADDQTLLTLALEKTEPPALDAAEAYLKAADEAAGLDDQLVALIDTINEANGVGQDAVTANIDFQNSMADLDEVIRKATDGLDENKDGVADYTLTLDQSTQAGRDNMGMLVGLAQSSQDAAKAQFALDGDTANYKKTLEDGHQAVVDRAKALGLGAEEAQNLADKIYAIPSEKQFSILADTADAEAKVGSLLTALGKIPTASGAYGDGLGVLLSKTSAAPAPSLIRRATGGILPGAPSAKDNILLHAATGEFITNAAQTAIPSNRAALEYMNSGGVIQGFTNGGMVSGRDVQYVPSYPSGGGFGSGSSSRTVNSTVNVTAIGPDANEVAAAVQRKQNWELRNG